MFPFLWNNLKKYCVLISVSICSLSVHGNAFYQHVFILLLRYLLNLDISSRRFFVRGVFYIPWDFLCWQSCHFLIEAVLFFPFQSVCLPLYWFFDLLKWLKHPALRLIWVVRVDVLSFFELMEKVFILSTWSTMSAVGFL